MTLPRGWPLLALAGAAIALAVYAGRNQGIATAFAVLALAAIGLLVLWPAHGVAAGGRSRGYLPPPELRSPFRAALQSGRSGRIDVVGQLDEVERRLGRPDLPHTTGPELARIRALSRTEFRAYVAQRLDRLEQEPT